MYPGQYRITVILKRKEGEFFGRGAGDITDHCNATCETDEDQALSKAGLVGQKSPCQCKLHRVSHNGKDPSGFFALVGGGNSTMFAYHE